jgi:hypothetical protein
VWTIAACIEKIPKDDPESEVMSHKYMLHNIYRSRGPGFDSRALPKKVVGLERGPLSLVSTTEELLDRKVAAPV